MMSWSTTSSSDKNPAFVPELVDRRPEGAWQINVSAAVLRLDVPMLKPDVDAALLELRPSYADAMAKAPLRAHDSAFDQRHRRQGEAV